MITSISFASLISNMAYLKYMHSFTPCTRLVLHICGCFSKSARSLCAPLTLKMPSRLWMVGLSSGKAKPPPWLGRVQRKMSKYWKISQETMKAISSNYQTAFLVHIPTREILLPRGGHLGLRPGHCPHVWAAGKIQAVLHLS